MLVQHGRGAFGLVQNQLVFGGGSQHRVGGLPLATTIRL